MAGGFSFPPPPPPPPKPAATNPQADFDSTQQAGRGGRGRGGFEPRGRGAGRGRGGGRGNSNFEPLGQSSGPARSWEGRDQAQAPNQGVQSNSQLPLGSYINPNFAGRRHESSGNFDARGGGPRDRREGARGSHTPHNANSNDSTSSTTARAASNDGPGRSQAGHKRKLDALRGPQQPRERKPGPPSAPSVPSFGAPILPRIPSAAPAIKPQKEKPANQPKPKPRTLGLTPQDGDAPIYPSESEGEGEDEDIDEEAQFAALGTKLTFEHDGQVMTLSNEADLAAWREERKKKFPTNHRVSVKEQEALAVGEERKRLLAAVARLHQAPRNSKTVAKTRYLRKPAESGEAPASSLQEEAGVGTISVQRTQGANLDVPEFEKPTGALVATDEQVTAVIQDVDGMEQSDHNVDASGETHATATEDQHMAEHIDKLPKALPGIDLGETDEESDGDADDVGDVGGVNEVASRPPSENGATVSDDDGPPEQSSSKPPPSADTYAHRPLCRFYSASGYCRDGEACRFRHELSNKAPSARPALPQPDRPAFDRFAPKLDPVKKEHKSIFERLVEQEERADDRLALQVIKAMGQAGFFKQPETEE